MEPDATAAAPAGSGGGPREVIAAVRARVLDDGAAGPYDELRATLDGLPRKVRRRPPWLRTSVLLNVTHRERAGQTRRHLQRLRDHLGAVGRSEEFAAFWARCVEILAPYSLGPHGYHRSLASLDSGELWADVEALITRLRGHGLEVFLVSGTLLGVVRDGDFVGHDDDVDLAVLVPGADADAVAAAWQGVRATLAVDGLLDLEFETRGFLHAKARAGSGTGIDLFPAWVRDDRVWIWPHTAGEITLDQLLPLGTVELAGRTLPVPRDPERLLELNYGLAWKVPDPLWSFDWEGAKVRFTEVRDAMLEHRPTTGPRRVVVHCGAYKAGSSAIQDWAWAHRDDLLANGILYPSAGLTFDEPDIGVRHAPLAWRHSHDRAGWDAIVDDLVAEVRASSAPTVLLSAEAWSRPDRIDSLRDLLDRLRSEGVLESAYGVLYLRNHLDYARRVYREMTRRRGNVKTFPEWLAGEPPILDELEVLRRLAPLVDDLEVVPYDEVGDTTRHLGSVLGAAYGASATRSNPGLDALETEAIRRLQLRAPQLLEAWPGLPAALPADLTLDPWAFEEVAEPSSTPDPDWLSDFTGRTGWTPAQVETFLDPGHRERRDVAEVADLLDGVVGSWLRRTAEQVTDTWLLAHPDVAALTLEPVDPTRAQQPLRGHVEPRPGAAPVTLVAISDAGEFPERPREGAGRFSIPSVLWGQGGLVVLVAESPEGHRTVVAHIARRWRSSGS